MSERRDNASACPKKSFISFLHGHPDGNQLFLLFNAAFILVCFGPLRHLFTTAWRNENYDYILFIPIISAYLIYQDRRAIFSQKQFSFAAGLLLIGGGILLLFLAGNILTLSALSMLLLWVGGFTLCYGARSLRAAAFPLLFLLFAVPIPDAVLERIIFFLQKGSTEVSYLFLKLAGVPMARDGFVFHLPTLDIEVAKQCSGIHSSLALFITGVLAARYFLKKGWTRILLLLFIVPAAVIKNGIRIFTLTAIAFYWDDRILGSDLHRRGGFVFFLITLVLVGAVIVLLRKAEERRPLKDSAC